MTEEKAEILVNPDDLPYVNLVRSSPRAEKLLGRQLPQRLHIVEALYLAYMGAARLIAGDGRELGFEDAMLLYSSVNPYAWVEFEVFHDLRRRGRLVVMGPRSHTLLMKKSRKSSGYSTYILVMEESRSIPVTALANFVEEAMKNGWEPLLAIVDRYGDIIYYRVTSFRPRQLREQGGWEVPGGRG